MTPAVFVARALCTKLNKSDASPSGVVPMQRQHGISRIFCVKGAKARFYANRHRFAINIGSVEGRQESSKEDILAQEPKIAWPFSSSNCVVLWQ